MEYAICRGMEITRLSSEQLVDLQDYERNTRLGCHPYEIQKMFNLPELKVAFEVPELEPAQAAYAQKLRNDYYKQGLFPRFQHVGVLDVEKLHEFDNALIGLSLDYVYQGRERRKSLREGLDDTPYAKAQTRIRADVE